MTDFKEGDASHSYNGDWCLLAQPGDWEEDDLCYGHVDLYYDCTEDECYHTTYCEKHNPNL